MIHSPHSSRLGLALLSALAICGSHRQGFAQGAAAKAKAKPIPFKVMSFNIRFGTANDGRNSWPRRAHRVVSTIEANNPDVLGLQEALPFQVAQLQIALPTYEVISRDREGTGKGETCAIFVRRARFAVRESGTFWLSPTPERIASKGWDTSLPRICTWVSLRDRRTGRRIRFANTHFDHRGAQARLESAKLLRTWLAGIRSKTSESRAHCVLVGDLNAGEDSAPIAALREGGYRDTFRVKHPKAKVAGTFSGFRKRGKKKIDYVWCDETLRVHAATIDGRKIDGQFPSDHLPVVATLSLPPQTKETVDGDLRPALRSGPKGAQPGSKWILAEQPKPATGGGASKRLRQHGLVRTEGGWRLWARAMGSTTGDLVFAFAGSHLQQSHWRRTDVTIRTRTDYGENFGAAPGAERLIGLCPVRIGNRNHLVFQGGATERGAQQICLATETRPDGFERHRNALGQSRIFAAPGARDPHVLRVGPTFFCVYLADVPRQKPTRTAVMLRTSADLHTWSKPKTIWDDKLSSAPVASPLILAREGQFFLFLTRPGPTEATTQVFRSKDPLAYPTQPTSSLPVAYPEIVQEHGQDYITSVTARGIVIQRLAWVD